MFPFIRSVQQILKQQADEKEALKNENEHGFVCDTSGIANITNLTVRKPPKDLTHAIYKYAMSMNEQDRMQYLHLNVCDCIA